MNKYNHFMMSLINRENVIELIEFSEKEFIQDIICLNRIHPASSLIFFKSKNRIRYDFGKHFIKPYNILCDQWSDYCRLTNSLSHFKYLTDIALTDSIKKAKYIYKKAMQETLTEDIK